MCRQGLETCQEEENQARNQNPSDPQRWTQYHCPPRCRPRQSGPHLSPRPFSHPASLVHFLLVPHGSTRTSLIHRVKRQVLSSNMSITLISEHYTPNSLTTTTDTTSTNSSRYLSLFTPLQYFPLGLCTVTYCRRWTTVTRKGSCTVT